MISREEIAKQLKKYDKKKLAIATICSHSALQIFHGARQEGFRTIGICTPDRRELYESYPLAAPDEFIIVNKPSDVLSEKIQSQLLRKNAVIVPHGSFVEYVGEKNICDSFQVPMFGNRLSLKWEGDRKKMMSWLHQAGCHIPRHFETPSQIDRVVIVKFNGAKGGRGYFLANSAADFEKKMKKRIAEGLVSKEDAETPNIQEFINGVRYYPHYFQSVLMGYRKGEKERTELLSMDKRLESNVDEIYRIMAAGTLQELDINPTYVVTGNAPITIRESMMPELLSIGKRVAATSKKLFGGIVGPYCVEMVVTPDLTPYCFEISARIVAGTNLYPMGSFLSAYLFKEPMSTGRRIARELKLAGKQNRLDEVLY